MGNKRVLEAKNLPRCSLLHAGTGTGDRGFPPSYYEDDPIVFASMGDERINEAKNLPRCSIPHLLLYTRQLESL